MSTVANSPRASRESLVDLLFRRPLPLERETSLYILVSALDLFMTWILLHHQVVGGGQFYESNPLARHFLELGGLRGIVFFKFAMVAFVAVVIQCVAMLRVTTARRLFGFATLAGCAVVIYSFSLLVRNTVFL